jgi:hypothetical protein
MNAGTLERERQPSDAAAGSNGSGREIFMDRR